MHASWLIQENIQPSWATRIKIELLSYGPSTGHVAIGLAQVATNTVRVTNMASGCGFSSSRTVRS